MRFFKKILLTFIKFINFLHILEKKGCVFVYKIKGGKNLFKLKQRAFGLTLATKLVVNQTY